RTIFRLLGQDYPDGKAAPEWKEILGQTRLK
ncbi:MAG: hypothetical protein RL403_59, partial [Bacteroidota bacterium]